MAKIRKIRKKPNGGGGVGGLGQQSHADVGNASESRLKNERENDNSIISASTHTLLTVRYCHMSDTFREHLTNARNQRYMAFTPPATTDLRTFAGGGVSQVGHLRTRRGGQNARFCGRPLWTAPKEKSPCIVASLAY